jgi:dicarboxylate transporter 10
MLVVSRPSTTLENKTSTATTNLATKITSLKPTQKASIQSPFWFGGAASCLATFVSHPFDLTKVRLQTLKVENSTAWSEFKLLSPTRMFKTMWTISRAEGITALYSGLSASLLRQGTYSTIRFGLYDQFKWSVAGDQSKFE